MSTEQGPKGIGSFLQLILMLCSPFHHALISLYITSGKDERELGLGGGSDRTKGIDRTKFVHEELGSFYSIKGSSRKIITPIATIETENMEGRKVEASECFWYTQELEGIMGINVKKPGSHWIPNGNHRSHV